MSSVLTLTLPILSTTAWLLSRSFSSGFISSRPNTTWSLSNAGTGAVVTLNSKVPPPRTMVNRKGSACFKPLTSVFLVQSAAFSVLIRMTPLSLISLLSCFPPPPPTRPISMQDPARTRHTLEYMYEALCPWPFKTFKKFPTVTGAWSPKTPMERVPAGTPAMEMSKKTLSVTRALEGRKEGSRAGEEEGEGGEEAKVDMGWERVLLLRRRRDKVVGARTSLLVLLLSHLFVSLSGEGGQRVEASMDEEEEVEREEGAREEGEAAEDIDDEEAARWNVRRGLVDENCV